jgi:putative ABC transport system substrate-binding protein
MVSNSAFGGGNTVIRRAFLGLGAASALAPGWSWADQPVTIGYLSARSPDESKHLLAACLDGLKSLGYEVGRNLQVEYRWADGQYDRLPALATELVREQVKVLVATGGEPAALAAKAATSTIPVVFSIGGDPVTVGLTASFNRPGGNATGVSLLSTTPEKKRLGLLHQVVPQGLIGVLINPNYLLWREQDTEVRDAARTLGRHVEIALPRSDAELEPAFAGLVAKQASALLVSADPFFDTRRQQIVALAERHKLPAMYQFRDYATAGGLMSYGIAIAEGYRQVGVYAGRILRGASPADLPVQQSIRFEFVINLKTAKALGLTIPPIVLATADEVIE